MASAKTVLSMTTIPSVPQNVRRPRAERAGRQRADVERADVAHIAPPAAGASFGRGSVRCANGQSCVPPSSGLFGQNHPTIVTNTGTAP